MACKRVNHKECIKLFSSIESYRTVYVKWHDMIKRCYNKNAKNYVYYGARGIKVCRKWKGKKGLYNFCKWILENGYDESKPGRIQSLDKINNDGNYEPSNCRIVTPSVQSSNKRSHNITGYQGVSLSSSGKCYYTRIRQGNKLLFSYSSKSKNDCAIKRNEFIINNHLNYLLNNIKQELEDVLPTYLCNYKCYDKEHNLIASSNQINTIAKNIGLSTDFVSKCILGIKNSKKYNFEKEERVIYEY